MAIDLDVHGNTKPLEAAVQAAINRIRRQPIKITVDDKGATQPLGNMRRAADEFSKSMEAANARILAFGASMAIINGVADAFKGMVRNMVEVEKSMADINVVMGLSAQNLDKFGDGLFKVAKETGAAFRVAADAATEYARQGLSMEESLKRTRDALILTRLTGMDSAEAVKSLTAAMNTYGNQIKDTTQLVSKFAAVDVQFAVSAEDFAAAISRTGQAAKSAGVNIDELIGIVTSAQQQTARGGAVIGNALKTIFTKTGRTDTLNQLENLGIAVRDLEGNTIGAKRILTDLANTFDKLSEAQQAQITQTMGGLFHINILKAVLSDAAKQNGILANATQISANATDEAIKKNEQLRQTMSAMATETGLAIKQVSTQIGELMLAPGMEKILNTVKSLAEGASEILGNGESAGNKFATGFLKGIGNIITGPGLVVLTTVFVKLFMTAAKFTKESLSSLIGVTSEAQKQKAIQTSLVALIGQNAALGKEMLRTDISRTEKEKILLGLLRMQTAEAENLNRVSKQLASTLYTKGYGPGLTTGKRRAYGHIPNFADPERSQAARGGYAAGSIRTMNMPGEGSVIYNSAETVKNFAGFKQPAIMPPQSSKAGKNYQQAFGNIHGFDPYAAGGYIPNFNRNLGGQKQGSLNAGGKDLVLLTGDQSGRDGSNIWYVGPNKSGAVTAYNSEALAKKRTTRFSAVEVPYFGLGTGDKSKIKSANIDEIDEKIRQTAVNQTVEIGKEFLKKGFKPEPTLKQKAERTFNNGAFSAAAGSTFESAMGAMLESDMFQDYSARTGTSLIDLPYSPQLFSLFGATGKGRMGGEVKGGLEQGLQKSAAEKFYKVLGLKLAAFQYKKGQEGVPSKSASSKFQAAGLRFGSNLQIPGQAKGVTAPGFQAAAEGFVPNFAAMTISRLGGLGKSKFGLAAVINSNPYFAQLLRRYGHWKNFPPQEKAKLNKFLLKQGFTNRTLQGYGLASMHSKSIGEGIANIAAAGGYIPNFADPLSDAIGREKAAGVPVSQIRVGSHSALMSKGNPLGLGVTNTHDEPNGLRDVFGANGFVPNYAADLFRASDIDPSHGNRKEREKLVKKINKELSKDLKQMPKSRAGQKEFSQKIESLGQQYNLNKTAVERVTKANQTMRYRLLEGARNLRHGNAGMALMMGLPMAAGFIQGDDPTNQARSGVGGAMMGAATGASIGMMFPGLGTAIGAAVGGLYGFVKGLSDAKDAMIKSQKDFETAGRNALSQGLAGSLSEKIFEKQDKKIVVPDSDMGGFKEVSRQEYYLGKSKKVEPLPPDIATLGSTVGGLLDMIHLGNSNFDKKLQEKLGLTDEQAKEISVRKDIISKRTSYAQEDLPKAREIIIEGLQAYGGQITKLPEIIERRDPEGKIRQTIGSGARRQKADVFLDRLLSTGMLDDVDVVADLSQAILKIFKDRKDSEAELSEAIILRLNKEKTLLSAQDKFNKYMNKSAETQASLANLYNYNLRTRGHLMTENEKAEEAYSQALITSAAKYEESVEKSRSDASVDIIKTLQGADYENKFKDYLAAKNIDSGEFAKKSLKEQREVLKLVGKESNKEKETTELLVNQKQEMDGIEEKAKSVLTIAQERAKTERDIVKELHRQQTGPGSFGRGMDAAFFNMRQQVEKMDYELGKRIPYAFADGLAGAMTEAINGAKDLKEALRDAAISFLGMIQQAIMQKLAYQVVGAMGFSQGGNVRNYSRGGGVPAMVSNGEYVMSREAVNKYGGSFMHGLNAGGRIPGFSNGGSPGSALAANFGGGRAYESGRKYQSMPMSSMFYAGQTQTIGMQEDAQKIQEIISEEERKRQEDLQERLEKKAKKRQLLGMGLSIIAGSMVSKGLDIASEKGWLGQSAQSSAALAKAGIPSSSVEYLQKNSGLSKAESSRILLGAKKGESWAIDKLNSLTNNQGNLLTGIQGRRIEFSNPSRPGSIPAYFNDPSTLDKNYLGGPIRKYARGGHISGKSGIDQIPAMLSEGEYVIRASSARQIGKPMLDRINAGKFNQGGAVSEIMSSSETGSSTGNTNNINISINMERGSSSKETKDQSSTSNNPIDRAENERDNAQLAERIKQQVVAVIVEEQRPGGLLSD